MTVVLLEGPDGGGKTTLASHPWLGAFERRHFGLLDDPLREYRAFASMAAASPRGLFVIERMHPSERIYGEVARGASRISAGQALDLERILERAGCVAVLCLPPFSACWAAWVGRGAAEYLKDEESLRAVWRLYRRWPSETSLPVVLHDRTRTTPERTLLRVRAILNGGRG